MCQYGHYEDNQSCRAKHTGKYNFPESSYRTERLRMSLFHNKNPFDQGALRPSCTDGNTKSLFISGRKVTNRVVPVFIGLEHQLQCRGVLRKLP